jgi:hypothetical protein
VISYVPLVITQPNVPSVKVTDTQLVNVLAQKDTSKLWNTYVQDVLINVTLVSIIKKTVLNVLKTESTNQSVLAHKVSITLTNKLTVQLVTKNVNLVSMLLITVSSVLKD